MNIVSASILTLCIMMFLAVIVAVFIVENKKIETAKACTAMGGIAVKQVDTGHTICFDSLALKKP